MYKDQVRVMETVYGKKPLAIYKKTIKGMVVVQLVDPVDFQNKQVTRASVVLQGDDYVPVYTPEEDAYFLQANYRLIELGVLVREGQTEEEKKKQPVEGELQTEEIEDILIRSRWPNFRKFVDEYVNTKYRAARLLEIAEKLGDRLTAKKVEYIQAKAIEHELVEQ